MLSIDTTATSGPAPPAAGQRSRVGRLIRRATRGPRAWVDRYLCWRWDCGPYLEDGRLTTRIILPNPDLPDGLGETGGKLVLVSFLRPDGRVAGRRPVWLPVGRTRVIDVARRRGLTSFGQVRLDWFFPARHARGGNRTVFHWYFAGGMTCVHEKKEPPPPVPRPPGPSLRPGQGYMTLFGVPPASSLDLYLVCLSQDWLPAEVRLRTFAAAGGGFVSRAITVPPRGTAWVDVRELLRECPEAVSGPLALDAAAYALSYYYFVHDRRDGTWQAQHL